MMALDNDQRNAAAQMLSQIAALPPAKREAVLAIVEKVALGERRARTNAATGASEKTP